MADNVAAYVRYRVQAGISTEEIEFVSPVMDLLIELIPTSAFIKTVLRDIGSLYRSTLFIASFIFSVRCVDADIKALDFIGWNYSRALARGEQVSLQNLLSFSNKKEYLSGKRYSSMKLTHMQAKPINAQDPAVPLEILKRFNLI